MDDISHQQHHGAWTWQTFLDDFIERESAGKSAATRRRYARVRDQMCVLVESLDVEESAGPEALVACLPLFVGDDWLMASDSAARTQVSLCDRLLTRLRRSGAVTPRQMFRTWLDADSAVFQARVRVRTRGAASRGSRPTGRPTLRLIRGELDDEAVR